MSSPHTWWMVKTMGTGPKSCRTRSPFRSAATTVVTHPSVRPAAQSMAACALLSTSRASAPSGTSPTGAGWVATVRGASAPALASTMLWVGMTKLSTMCSRCRFPKVSVCSAG